MPATRRRGQSGQNTMTVRTKGRRQNGQEDEDRLASKQSSKTVTGRAREMTEPGVKDKTGDTIAEKTDNITEH